MFVGWGFTLDLTGGAYSSPPDPLAVFIGLRLKKGEKKRGQREEKWVGDGSEGEEEKEGEKSKGMGMKGMRKEGSFARPLLGCLSTAAYGATC